MAKSDDAAKAPAGKGKLKLILAGFAEAARAAGYENLTLLEEPQAALYSWIQGSEGRWRKEVKPGDVILTGTPEGVGPLTSGDEFISRLALRKEGIKYVFVQDIYRLPDLKPVIKSTVETVCVVNGRLSDSALFNEIFAPYLNQ